MRELEQRRKTKRFLYAPVTLIALFILVLIFARAVWNVSEKESLSATRLERAQIEHENLTKRQETLSKEVEFMKTEAGVDATIRSKFRVVKEGEEIAVIINRDATTTDPVPKTPSVWERITRFFGF